MADDICHICGFKKSEPGSDICSYPHPAKAIPIVADFSSKPDPIPEFPFSKVDATSAKEVAWLVFSRLYVVRLNPLMCVAPIGFRDELETHFEYLCTKHTARTVMFECDSICDEILPEHFQRIMANRVMVQGMIVRSSSMYPGTAKALSAEEAMILATALGLSGVGKLIPLKLEDGNLWSSI